MSVARTLIKLREFQVFNTINAPYSNDAMVGTTVGAALDWVFAVLYPNSQPSVANVAALPTLGNTLNDYRIVIDDGDGLAAGYRWESREGDVAPSWYKIHDMDWSSDGILSALIDQTNELYVSKYGREDQDESGTPIAGVFAGQNVYGGTTAGSSLTLHGNSGDISELPADQTGYIQFNGDSRPTADAAFDMGTTTERFRDLFLSGDLNDGTITVTISDIADAIIHAAIVSGNPHGTGYDDLSDQLGTITVDGDVSGSVDLSSSGNKTLTITVADDSHNHVKGNIDNFDNEVYLLTKAILKDSSQVTWSFNDGLEEATPTVAVTTSEISDMASPANDKILVSNAAGTAWVQSNGEIELLGDATGSATYDSATDKWSITTTVASSTLAGISDIDLTTKAITSISVANPSNIERNGHGLRTGDMVRIFASTTTPDINNTAYTVTVVDANNFTIPVDVTVSSVPGYFIPTGGQLLYNPTTGKFEVAKEFEQIRLGELDGLTEDVLSIYAAIGGRSGGQTINGGISASQSLTLESTAHATKGSVLFASKATPVADAVYSGGWTGTDIGATTKKWNDLFMSGEFKGGRFENLGSLPTSSGTTIGRPVYYASNLYVDTGSAYVKVGASDIVVSTKTANHTITIADDVILVDATSGAITITLPVASGIVKSFKIKKIDSSANAVTIDGNGSEEIDDALTYVIENQYIGITIVSDNSNWYVI